VALPEARELAIVLITIGPRLEKQVPRYSKGGDVTRAAILDDIGSTAADMAVADVRRRLAKQVTSRGYELSSPVSPGMPGFPLTEQRHLLQLAGAAKIGVAVTASGVFVPRKLISMVMGVGSRMTRWTSAEVCARCGLRNTCRYKVSAWDESG